jgi:hypothetical protein
MARNEWQREDRFVLDPVAQIHRLRTENRIGFVIVQRSSV